MIAAASVAVLALSMVASASASAATAGWMVGGTQLVGSAAVATTAAVDEVYKASAGGLEVECSGATLNNVKPEISAANKGTSASIVFTGCKSLTKSCAISKSEIATVPVTIEVTLEGALGVSSTFSPQSGTLINTFKFEGEACSVAGLKAVTGKATTSTPVGQDEHTLQLSSVNTSATSAELKLGASAASVSGSSLLKLASGLPWSFL
jgi:hypothetical protein